MVSNQEIKNFIEYLSKELKMEALPFEHDLQGEEGGNLAKLVLNEEGKPVALSLSPNYLISFDLYYQIARELRRAWQIVEQSFLLHGYKTREELSHEEFCLQKAEVDVHAYASIALIDGFHIKPLFEGLPHKAVVLIRHRIDEIVDERDNPEYYEEDFEEWG